MGGWGGEMVCKELVSKFEGVYSCFSFCWMLFLLLLWSGEKGMMSEFVYVFVLCGGFWVDFEFFIRKLIGLGGVLFVEVWCLFGG